MNKNSIDVKRLKEALTAIVGDNNALFADSHAERLQPYLRESRERQVGTAFAAVFPRTTEEVSQVVATCYAHRAPIVPQGGNTGRCFGAQTDDPNAVIVNLRHLNRIRALDADNMTVTVEAGAVLQDIQAAVAAHGYFFPLSLGAEGSCQIGGNLATNAGGINVLRYGNARELTLGVEAVVARGEILHALSGLRKNNTGYDLKNLLIGSEGTLGIITTVTLKIFPPESNNSHAFIAINSIDDAVTTLRRLQARFEGRVSTFELLPQRAISLMHAHSHVDCPIDAHHPWYVWYKVADSHIDKPLFNDNVAFLHALMQEGLVVDATVAQNEGMKKHFEKIRETIVGVQQYAGVAVKNDISVPVSSITCLVEQGNAAIARICPDVRPYPFGHVGDGNIHYNLMRPAAMDDATFLAHYKEPLQAAILDIVYALNGSFSAEHGVGSQKVTLMQTYQDPVALAMMRDVKRALDPLNLMNPHKVIPDV